MGQFYYKNGKLWVFDSNTNTVIPLRLALNKTNINFANTYYLFDNPALAKKLDNSFTPVTELQINTFRSKLNNNFFDAMKYASKEMLSTNPKKKINVTSSNSSTPSNSSTSPKRTQYQRPEGVKTRDDIIKIQQMLADANMLNGTNKYNLGTYGAKGNGVDGIWGAKTDAAYKQYLKDLADYHTSNIETEPIKVNTPFLLKPMKGVRISPDYSTPLMPSFNQFTLPWRNVWDDIKAGRRDSLIDYAKRGGIVRKFQEGNKFNFIKAEDIFKKTIEAIKELDKKILQVRKAASLPKKKSNNKVTTTNTTAQLLLALYNAGMFNGIKKNGKQVSFELAVDGLHGNLTNQAIKNALKAGYNVDTNAGIITKKEKTKLFPEKTIILSSIMSPFSKPKDELLKAIQNKRCTFGNCAKFSNGTLREQGYIPRGDAWNLKNVDMIYSGYNTTELPQEYNKNEVISYNNKAAENFKKTFNIDNLNKDEKYIVNMYYKDSPALETAYNEGNGITGTHTGYLSFNPNKNKWELIHETNGIIHTDPFDKALGSNKLYGITTIYSPRKNNLINQFRDLIGV